MSKISKISGFPEWLPEHKLLENQIIGLITAAYESHGFTPIETPAVELMETLAAKGVVDKEIFQVSRAQADANAEAELGLHFDLTVPFARYVALHFNELQFPFRRYQLQKVWRGDRPQRGRFREFYQFDIDIIARENLPLSCDAEVIELVDAAFRAIKVLRHSIKLNNRKILQGFYRKLGLDDAQRKQAIIAVDKIHKIGRDGVLKELREHARIEAADAEKIVAFATHRAPLRSAAADLAALLPDDPWCAEGLAELVTVGSLLPEICLDSVEVDLSLARGLDYYTGTIVEVCLPDYPEFGSVSAGGRYEDLASQFINKKLPGVGLSIGLSRLMELIISENLMPSAKRCPTTVLVAVLNEEQRAQCNAAARRIRAAGTNAEVYFQSPKLGKQIDYAAAKAIPYILFVSESGEFEVKDLSTKEQKKVSSLEAWCTSLTAGI
ncbi:MAG: histidine--tRNA ligase [Deltaproteobacteria bacterium]|nr:histidine--tRNA ligase [Deltaproteobacteria bacterium]